MHLDGQVACCKHRGLNRNTFASPFCFGCMARVMESEVSHLGPLTCFVKGLCNRVAADWSTVISDKNQSVPAMFSTFERLRSCFISSRIVRTVSVSGAICRTWVFFLPPPGTITPSSQSISSQVSRRRSLRLKHFSMATISNFRLRGRTETERKPYQYRLTLHFVERTQQNPYGLVVKSVEQTELSATRSEKPTESATAP